MLGIILQKFFRMEFWYLPHAIIVKNHSQHILSEIVLPHLRITWNHAKNIYTTLTLDKNS